MSKRYALNCSRTQLGYIQFECEPEDLEECVNACCDFDGNPMLQGDEIVFRGPWVIDSIMELDEDGRPVE